MRFFPSTLYPLIFLLAATDATGVGRAWRVLPYSKPDYWNHPSWPRLDTSAFEVRTISGVGRLIPIEPAKPKETNPIEPNALPVQPDPSDKLSPFDDYPDLDDLDAAEKILKADLVMTVLEPNSFEGVREKPRVRRDAENDTKMEQIATTKNVRDVRLTSPETWSTQPISVEFRHRTSLDQMIQQAEDDAPPPIRTHQAPSADFVTSHRRSYAESREPREMVTRNYDEYEQPWYRNAIRAREYDPPSYRRGFSYYYPERYRTERDYYTRMPADHSYYYDRYRNDDFDLYGRSRPTPKPKRIIYYATLPEIVRKPVDLRNYPRSYDGLRSPMSRDGSYKRIPGNVDPSRFRYRNLYDGYDPYTKRASLYDRYPEDERRKTTMTESLRNDGFDQGERKLSNQISVRSDGKLPWPVQIGTEVSVKEDDRIPGRKIFGESTGYERFQSAQLQKAPDATGSSELQSDN